MPIKLTAASILIGLSFGLCAPLVAQSTDVSAAPLSVIDWLDQMSSAPAEPIEPPVSRSGGVPQVTVTPLGGPGPKTSGLVPGAMTGLPATLWQESRTEEIEAAISEVGVPTLPAMQALLYSLLLTEAFPPAQDVPDFQLARINALMEHGALEPALALTESLSPESDARLFAAFFDLSLIAGTEQKLCRKIAGNPLLAPDKASEIFCRARSGDWETATLLLGTADALNLLRPETARALERFLDPDLFEGAGSMPTPQAPDPLTFTLYEALGHRLPTQTLPRIYAHADLSDRAGWKSQLEAAERLATTGAIPDNRLLGFYSNRRPAASGGVWDRVIAIQQFDTALKTRSVDAISKTLPAAWNAATDGGFPTRFATLFATGLRDLPLSGETADVAFEVLLLSADYEAAAFAFPDRALRADVLTGIAAGETRGLTSVTPLERAVLHGFATEPVPLTDPLGLAILQAIADVEAGAAGDLARLPRGLARLRGLNLEDTVRQAALQILLLRGRG